MDESLRKLGVEKLSKEDVQKMQWEVLEAKIGNWIHFMRIAVSTLWTCMIVCMLYFLVSKYVLSRSRSCLLEKEESAIKYLKGLILSLINVLLNVLLVVSPCFLVSGMQLPEAKGHLRSYLYFWTCMR
jgi:hypothetical protein